MKLVIQRVRRAEVRVEDQVVGSIGYGALILVGVARGDTMEDAAYLARKTAHLRIYEDEDGKLNAPIDDIEGGAFLAVSQFTLYGDCGKGNRPSYMESAGAEEGRQGYEWFVEALRRFGRPVETGLFQEYMVVDLENDGPVTILMESRGRGVS